MSRQLLIYLYILLIVYVVIRNSGSTHFFRINNDHSYTRRQVALYAGYSLIVMLIALQTLPKHKPALEMVVVWLAVLYAPILVYKPSFQVYYSTKDAEVFRSMSPKTTDGKNEISKMTYQTTTMPLFKDKARTIRVGRFYSSAEIFAIDAEQHNEVMQYITFVFEGKDDDLPVGNVAANISFKNDIHNIFPSNDVYRASILNGTEAYQGVSGTVEVTVQNDERSAVFNI